MKLNELKLKSVAFFTKESDFSLQKRMSSGKTCSSLKKLFFLYKYMEAPSYSWLCNFTIKNSGFHKLLIVTGNWHLCDSPTHTKWGHKWQDIKVLFLTLAKGNLKVFDRKLMSTFPWCLHFYLVICDTGLCLLMNLDWTEKGYKERYLKYFMSRNTLYCSVCRHTSIYIIVHD